MKKKAMIAILAVALAFAATVGGTMAWLIDKTEAVTNTFTYGDINIELAETTGDTYTIVPGNDITKDPVVTVNKDSEACWLFVEIIEANWPDLKTEDGLARKVDYTIADGWAAIEEGSKVYYREVNAVDADTKYQVLKDNKIVVSGELTKDEVDTLKNNTPTLKITAYAVQKSSAENPTDAWDMITE